MAPPATPSRAPAALAKPPLVPMLPPTPMKEPEPPRVGNRSDIMAGVGFIAAGLICSCIPVVQFVATPLFVLIGLVCIMVGSFSKTKSNRQYKKELEAYRNNQDAVMKYQAWLTAQATLYAQEHVRQRRASEERLRELPP